MNNAEHVISIGEFLESIDRIIAECYKEYIFNKCVKTIAVKENNHERC